MRVNHSREMLLQSGLLITLISTIAVSLMYVVFGDFTIQKQKNTLPPSIVRPLVSV
jgi:hypothetical protein